MKQAFPTIPHVLKFSGLASTVAVCAALMIGIMSGCGSTRRDVPYSGSVDLSNPVVARGQQVFMANCNQCHPGGAAGLAPALNDKPLSAGLINLQVRSGLGAMPAFDKNHIPDADLDAIVAYLKALRKTTPVEK